MQPEATPAFVPHLCQRFSSLIWSCIDAGLCRSAIFYAERYFALDQHNHDARHLYAASLFGAGLTQSALCVVNVPLDEICQGCLELKARCCTAIGRYRHAMECLEGSMKTSTYAPSRMWFIVIYCEYYKICANYSIHGPKNYLCLPRRSCLTLSNGEDGPPRQSSR
jgi:hypothetical protein